MDHLEYIEEYRPNGKLNMFNLPLGNGTPAITMAFTLYITSIAPNIGSKESMPL